MKIILGALASLHEVSDPDELRATWRQSMATLGAAVLARRAVPLEGLPPERVQASIRAAIASNLLDELDFLSPPARAASLYELGAALPAGYEKREVGRRALKMLREGDAPTFVGLATLLALGSSRALSGTAIRARVSLCLDLPIGAGARVDALALALISRPETAREWLTLPATGSLPSRRLAARLLERAAREAARRYVVGDQSVARVFEVPAVRDAWNGLLNDREPLVWRHVATARGLLSLAVEDFADEIHRHQHGSLTPTEWRRAATSLAASIAVAPDEAVAQAQGFLNGRVFERDPGIASAMALGLPRAAEAEPEAAEALLGPVILKGGLDALEALVDIRDEQVSESFGAKAFQIASERLAQMLKDDDQQDEGRTALMEALLDDLTGKSAGKDLVSATNAALMGYAEESAAHAFREARNLLTSVEETVRRLEGADESTPEGRRVAFRAMRELDMALLEKATLSYMLSLDSREKSEEAANRAMANILDRVTRWLVAKEETPIASEDSIEHFTLRMRRVRMWLHLVDAEGSYGGESSGGSEWRRLESARTLLLRVRDDAQTRLSRVTCAATARACDALVREELLEVSDVLIAVSRHALTPRSVKTFAQASTVPAIKECVEAYALLSEVLEAAPDSLRGRQAVMEALLDLANALPISATPRLEALRVTLLDLAGALSDIVHAPSLEVLMQSEAGSPLDDLETSVGALARLVSGAERRFAGRSSTIDLASGRAIRQVDLGAEHALRGSPDPLAEALEPLGDILRSEVLPRVGDAIVFALGHLRDLPKEGTRSPLSTAPPTSEKAAPLPPWLPPGRTLGSFYVVRALGGGAVGTVFVARRVEDKNDKRAPKFALKVPEYAGAAARELSEEEFNQLFREEAGALLALPEHPHLARLVTFDAGAKPKPILVMELVEGPTLERVLRMGDMTMSRSFDILDGIASGLDTMHSAGLGHLDVKPSNVIIREGDSP
ncbi:MAG: protein kinase, partial [Myxococcales bacterium]|nr:protein kinase [Myxococcales bacterium]